MHTDSSLLPHRLIILGQAMLPVLERAQAVLAHPAIPAVGGYMETAPDGEYMANISQHYLDRFGRLVNQMVACANGFMGEVVSNEGVSDNEVYQSAARFQAFLEVLAQDYEAVYSLKVLGADAEARDLLAGCYRYTLEQTRAWLQDLVDALSDPMAFIQKRGLPTQGHVELPLILYLDEPPQLAKLGQWAERCTALLPEPGNVSRFAMPHTEISAFKTPRRLPQTSSQGSPGFFEILLTMAFGAWISKALFGRNDDECSR